MYLSRFCVLFGFYSLEKIQTSKKESEKKKKCVYVSVDEEEEEEEVQTEKVFGDFRVCAPWCACVRACVKFQTSPLETQNLPT